MRPLIPFLIASLALAALASSRAPAARADDPAADQSPAAKAYRDAWWAETGGGNLAQAVEVYTKAADAEGPATVKARALYRKAIVLQRIGKTEDAIRTLERLAKDHPLEGALQTDARARLAEWTAVDLKTSFGEWYERYKYSPEFQAKIVDLVLKMGVQDATVGEAIVNEILTIGAPAIPALKQHLASPNQVLRYRIEWALLRLGEIPSLETLRPHAYRGLPWDTLRASSAEVRARLRSEARVDDEWDQVFLAAIEGPVALLTWVRTSGLPKTVERLVSGALTVNDRSPDLKVLRPMLVELAEQTSLPTPFRETLVTTLFNTGGLDAPQVESWAFGSDPFLRERAVSWLINYRSGEPTSRAVLRRLLPGMPTWGRSERQAVAMDVIKEVLVGVDGVTAADELDRLADDLLPLIKDGYSWQSLASTGARAVFARMLDRAHDESGVIELWQAWRRDRVLTEVDLAQLVAWVKNGRTNGVRHLSAQELPKDVGAGQERAVALLREPGVEPSVRARVFQSLLAHPQGLRVLADPAHRRVLLETGRAGEQVNPGVPNAYWHSLGTTVSQLSSEARGAIALEWLANPVSYPRMLLWDSNMRGSYVSLVPAWIHAWATWTPAQRDAAVEGLGTLQPAPRELTTFLRAAVRDTTSGISIASRRTMLQFVGPLTVEDLRTGFDLGTPAGTDDAIAFLWSPSRQNSPVPSPDLFEALKPGLRPDGPEAVAQAMHVAFQGVAQLQRPLIEAMLAHRVEKIQENALALLSTRESSEDLPLWLQALALPSVRIRTMAASGLGRIAHPDATKALVATLDDRSSAVRDAALVSLEAIQKIEELKKSWRAKAEGIR